MILVIYKAFAALVIFLASIIPAIYPITSKKNPHHAETLALGEALASGIFLGVAFFHMLPSAIHTFNELYGQGSYPIAEAICMGGFLLLLFLERLTLANSENHSHTNAIPYLLTCILSIHALTEGAALGIGKTYAESLLIFIAIMAHKSSASFALSVTLVRYPLPLKRLILMVIAFSLMSPLGIGFGTVLCLLTQSRNGELITAIFNAFAAGTFLYISALHHIQFHKRISKANVLLEFAFLAMGVIAMGAIAVFA